MNFGIELKMVGEIPVVILPDGIYEFVDFNRRILKAELSQSLAVDLLRVNFVQFFNFLKAGAYFDDRYWTNSKSREAETVNQLLIERGCDPWNPDEPIKVVPDEAMAFANWSQKRLLTEVEWEVFAAFTEGMILGINNVKFNQKRNEKRDNFWRKIHRECNILNSFRKQFEEKFSPMTLPGEFCIEERNKKTIVKGRVSKMTLPCISENKPYEPEKLFTFRCCKEV